MGRTKPGTVQYTGASAGSRLVGSSPHNKGILIEVFHDQDPNGKRVEGPFVLVDAGEGTYAAFLGSVIGRRFESAADLVAAARAAGADKCTHVVNRNCLKLAHEPAPGAQPASRLHNGDIALTYDVALSFAGEDRSLARQLASMLRSRNLSVFYDEYERANLWGKDLHQHLTKVYRDFSRFCVIFVSRAYTRKLWTRHELRKALERALGENREYVLPLRLDDTELPALPANIAYIDGRQIGLEVIADALTEKLRGLTPPIRADSGTTPSE